MRKKILDISKRRGIVYPSFEVYGGASGFYDYGPIGSRIKQNIENLVREYYVVGENCFEVECPTLSLENVWIASGHVKNFTDMLTECLRCSEPYRADHLVGEHLGISCEAKSIEELSELIKGNDIRCPKCKGALDKVYHYNLMFKTEVGRPPKTWYLRPETAQTTYLAFKRLWEIGRRRLPLGVLQIGHSFRNEISPRQGMIRLREFNQAEIQFFVDPEGKVSERFHEVSDIKAGMVTKDEEEINTSLADAVKEGIIEIELIAYLLGRSLQLFREMGINGNSLSLRQHMDEERAFYSSDTWDIEFMSEDFGRIELVGVSDRTDYDLRNHINLSGVDFSVNYEGRKFIPHVVEVAYGIDRPFYCVLESCLVEEKGRTYMKFPKKVAPYLAAVFPLVNKDGVPEKSREVFELLRRNRVYVLYDRSGSIGRRYARADEVGVPYCITIDYDTLRDDTVTIRDRDTKGQERVRIDELYRNLIHQV
ncbi:MAG: glycine--tRNA ligase [Candidatus Altiarchaeota archaeon]|nr:glycine--tRNA ligase [Candidatus Altiarchaeota archaeon]